MNERVVRIDYNVVHVTILKKTLRDCAYAEIGREDCNMRKLRRINVLIVIYIGAFGIASYFNYHFFGLLSLV